MSILKEKKTPHPLNASGVAGVWHGSRMVGLYVAIAGGGTKGRKARSEGCGYLNNAKCVKTTGMGIV